MDQKRLFIAIAISVVILAVFQFVLPARHRPPPPAVSTEATQSPAPATGPLAAAGTATPGTAAPGAGDAAELAREVPRVKIAAPRVSGSLSLVGARLDDVVLNDYRETIDKDSPLVRLLEPKPSATPSYVQFGWTADGGQKVPDNATLWTASAQTLAAGKPVTLSWDNGAGLTFEIAVAIDDNYLFTVTQRVRNATDAPVSLRPWARVRRDYTPVTAGYSVLHEGFVGWEADSLHDVTYSSAKSEGEKHDGIAYTGTSTGGWAGFTDKYWLSAVIADQQEEVTTTYRSIPAGAGAFQVDFVSTRPVEVAAHGEATHVDSAFVGAKDFHLLERYAEANGISHFYKAIDWGWFEIITRPFYQALDFLYRQLGNFGLAILAFTIIVKLLFFPLANYSYRSMSKMKLLGPKLQAIREQYKDDPTKIQQQTMAIYKAEKINPASGCLPMVIQIPIFFSLYKVIFINIDMRQAPFFGWIHDLSAIDPTNVFNLFGLIPFDPTVISPFLHLGLWPLFMGFTMWAQQKMNPPPPDPTQAKLFQFMPIIFTFMLARFPAGLVIYWSWNNLLTIGQQWLIMRQTRLSRPGLGRMNPSVDKSAKALPKGGGEQKRKVLVPDAAPDEGK
jgi:YidC/Oxa1 family membrane protein insertase